MTLVLIEKGLVLEGWPSKIELSLVLGKYTNSLPKKNIARNAFPKKENSPTFNIQEFQGG